MLAKDMFAVNDIDAKIKSLIDELAHLIDERKEMTSPAKAVAAKPKRAKSINRFDFSSLDLNIDSSSRGLSIN